MPLVDISGAYDLHIHSNPSLFERSGSDLDVARHASESGLAGVLLKNHFESTVGRAALTQQEVPEIKVFGSLALNNFAGGMNPSAVECALKLGAKEIFMPTMDAAAHIRVFGHAGGYGYQESGMRSAPGAVSAVNEKGELTSEAKQVVELVRDFDAILGTAHLGADEIFQLARFARDVGLTKLLITHPYFDPPKLTVAQQKELVRLGARLELCGGNLYPIPGVARLDNYLETLAEIDPSNLIISSDAGQPRKSAPSEVLRIFTQCLTDKGVGQDAINLMVKENPARLLGL